METKSPMQIFSPIQISHFKMVADFRKVNDTSVPIGFPQIHNYCSKLFLLFINYPFKVKRYNPLFEDDAVLFFASCNEDFPIDMPHQHHSFSAYTKLISITRLALSNYRQVAQMIKYDEVYERSSHM